MAKDQVSELSDLRQYLEDLARPIQGRPARRKLGKRVASTNQITEKMPGASYVYAISGGDKIKFGKADCPLGRMRALQTGSPFELSFVGYARFSRSDVYSVERAVFEVAAGLRIERSGEWLHIGETDAAYLLSAATSVCGIDPMHVCGFAVDEDYTSPFDLVRDWSATGSFNSRKWR